jgi:hypothetical protein
MKTAQTTSQSSPDHAPPAGDVRAFGAKGNRNDQDDKAFSDVVAAAMTHDQYPSAVRVPAGHYRRARPIGLPNHVALRGEGMSSVLNSQNDDGFNAPILTNLSSASAVDWRISNISLFGGSHGVKLDVSAEVTNARFDDVNMLMQKVANIEANQMFQTSKFFGGILGSAPYGLKVNNRTTNAFNSFGLEWTDHSECSMYLRGAETVLVVGGRFEGGGRAGKATIDIEDGASITFIGVYFEAVHEYLARLRRVQVVSFVNCHFTGTHAGSPKGLAPFKWDIDANLLVFRDCHSSVPMPVPGNVVLDGVNANIFPAHAVHDLHGLHGRIIAAPRSLQPAGTVNLLAVLGAPVSPSNPGLFHCELGVTIARLGTNRAIEHWSATFEIVEADGKCQISLPRQPTIELNGTEISLTIDSDQRLAIRYRSLDRGSLTQLSWTVEWRRVAGGPISSLTLHVP